MFFFDVGVDFRLVLGGRKFMVSFFGYLWVEFGVLNGLGGMDVWVKL